MIEFIFEHRRATADQLRRRFFSPGAASRMRHWLAILRKEGYLEQTPRRRVIDAAIYKIGGRSHRGLALLRETYGDTEVRRRASAFVQDEHYVLITECYVAIWAAVRAAGWELLTWEDAIELRVRTDEDGIVPDAYFCLRSPGGSIAPFFLELERTTKSQQSMRRKLEKHRKFFRSGRYKQVFRWKSLRVLFVLVRSEKPRIDPAEQLCLLAENMGASFICATSLAGLVSASGAALLVEPRWRRAGRKGPYALFEGTS